MSNTKLANISNALMQYLSPFCKPYKAKILDHVGDYFFKSSFKDLKILKIQTLQNIDYCMNTEQLKPIIILPPNLREAQDTHKNSFFF